VRPQGWARIGCWTGCEGSRAARAWSSVGRAVWAAGTSSFGRRGSGRGWRACSVAGCRTSVRSARPGSGRPAQRSWRRLCAHISGPVAAWRSWVKSQGVV